MGTSALRRPAQQSPEGHMPDLLSSRLQRQSTPVPVSTLTAVLIAVVVIGGLYFGREVLVAVALALLLSFVLAPLVRLLEGWYFPRGAAVIVVVLIAFAAIFGLGALMLSQVNQLAGDLPSYQSTLREKIRSLRGAAAGTGTLERASEILQDLSREIDKPNNSGPGLQPAGRALPDRPIPVEVRQPDPGALQTLVALITPLIKPLTTTGIVLVFVVFILIQRRDVRNRLVRLAGAQDLQRTTAALDDAGQRLSRLFLTQLALNASFGLVIGLGLWIIGVPSAPLWGMLAMILRFVPYVGALLSALLPLILAAAVGPGWAMVLLTAALFLIAETVAGQAIEPLVYGQSTGLSPVAVIAAATFWTWLWGPIGLVLATPLTMCLAVVGKHVDRLKFLEVLFGDEPPLTPAELIYQRMLARDPIEAAEQAEAFLKKKPLLEYYDEILLEGLKLAQADAERDLLDENRQQAVRDAVAEIVDDLADHEDKPARAVNADSKEQPLAQLKKVEGARVARLLPAAWQSGTPVLCIPGLGLLDEAAALILAHLVGREGIGARAEQAGALSMARLFSLDTNGVALICLCYVEYATAAQIRYAIRRIRRKAPDVIILVALFGNASETDEQYSPGRTEFVQQSFAAAVDKVIALASLGEKDDSRDPSTASATNEGMAGNEEGLKPTDSHRLGEVVRAKAGIGERAKQKPSH
jgi:predicted PurR-regulated permease PerM